MRIRTKRGLFFQVKSTHGAREKAVLRQNIKEYGIHEDAKRIGNVGDYWKLCAKSNQNEETNATQRENAKKLVTTFANEVVGFEEM